MTTEPNKTNEPMSYSEWTAKAIDDHKLMERLHRQAVETDKHITDLLMEPYVQYRLDHYRASMRAEGVPGDEEIGLESETYAPGDNMQAWEQQISYKDGAKAMRDRLAPIIAAKDEQIAELKVAGVELHDAIRSALSLPEDAPFDREEYARRIEELRKRLQKNEDDHNRLIKFYNGDQPGVPSEEEMTLWAFEDKPGEQVSWDSREKAARQDGALYARRFFVLLVAKKDAEIAQLEGDNAILNQQVAEYAEGTCYECDGIGAIDGTDGGDCSKCKGTGKVLKQPVAPLSWPDEAFIRETAALYAKKHAELGSDRKLCEGIEAGVRIGCREIMKAVGPVVNVCREALEFYATKWSTVHDDFADMDFVHADPELQDDEGKKAKEALAALRSGVVVERDAVDNIVLFVEWLNRRFISLGAKGWVVKSDYIHEGFCGDTNYTIAELYEQFKNDKR